MIHRRYAATLIALLAAVSGCLAGLFHLREPLGGLRRLAAAMPAGPERIAGAPSDPRATDRTFTNADVSSWPPDALRALRLSLQHSSSNLTPDLRLGAAVDFFRGECAAAAATLEVALRERPTNAQILNDAAAAHACAARRAKEEEEAGPSAIRAIDRALAALDVRPNWTEPWTNLASAYETLGLADQAREALARARVFETDPGLVRALERRISGLATPRPAAPQQLSEYVLLARWAQLASGGASTLVEETALAGEAERRARLTGDLFLSDVVRTIREATPRARQQLALGHLAYARGKASYDAGARERAGQEFSQARTLFAEAHSSFAVDASLQHAIVLYQRRMLDEASAELTAVSSSAASHRYRALAARASWIAGLIDMQRGFIDRAAALHLLALRGYEALGDFENSASVANSAADTLRIAGDNRRGWPMVVRAARMMAEVSSQRRYLILFNLSLYAQDEGQLRAAELFQDAAAAEADRRGNPLTIVESRLRRAQLSLRRGRTARAAQDVESAGARMDAVQSSSSAAYLRTWRERLGAALEVPRAPLTASARLEALASDFQRIEPAEVPGVYLEAGRAALGAGDRALAERQLGLGADFVLARGARLETIEYRAGYLSAAWDIFHDLIGLRFARDRAGALAIAETARRALARREPGVTLPASSVPSLQADTALLYYSALKDRVLVWTMGPAGLTSQAIQYAEEDLAADVDAYRQSLVTAHRDRGRGEVGRRLYDRLVVPALSRTGPEIRVLLIAPDGPLGDLPFGALFMASGERLVERYEIAFVAQLPRAVAPRDPGVPASLLAVGFNGGDSQLPALAAAEREAALVSRLYARPATLIGGAATGDALRRAAPGHDVIHVAAHARANRLMPWESRLMLAPDGAAGGAVRFETIGTWDLHDCRLVVLSACETSTASRARGQGLLSLASPFLDAGARVVIGTLWPVDDRASVAFMQLLHRHVAAGRPPADALRAAQLAALRSDDPNLSAPFTWAAYVATTR